MLAEADKLSKDAAQIDPAWGFERRRHAFAHVIRLVCDVERMLGAFGGVAVVDLRARAETIREAALTAEEHFRKPAPKVTRAKGPARFLAEVRRLAEVEIRGTTGSAGIWDAIAVRDVIIGTVRALDDLDRCLAAGKPARMRLVAWPLETVAGEGFHT